ncbi:hypothetical protein [Streptomyces mirabilis]|uniref:hypothetical protein n=1 Tax=Streptomyces mirabilis TaxID=68239 RepID=UPI0037F14560
MTDLRDSPERHQPTNHHAHRHDDTPRPIPARPVVGARHGPDRPTVTPVRAELVVVDVARDASGRWRHPARLHHARPDVPSLTSPR